MGRRRTRIIAVASGKGGVGKTSVSVNLAWALGMRGRRTCLLDADLGLSNVDILLGLSPEKTLEDVLFGGLSLESAVVPVAQNVDVLPGSSGVQRMAELSRSSRLKLSKEFSKLDAYDYLLIDTSPGISSQVVSLCLSARELIVPVTPDVTSITDAYALIKVLKDNGMWWSPSILVNKATGERQARMVFERIQHTTQRFLKFNCRYLGSLGRDDAVSVCASLRRPVVEAVPESPFAGCMTGIAAYLDKNEHARGLAVAPAEFMDQSALRLKQKADLTASLQADRERLRAALDSLAKIGAELSAVREELGDMVRAESSEARAACFKRAMRRLATAEEHAVAKAASPGSDAETAVPELGAAKGAPREAVLVVCPNGDMRQLLREVLAEAGLEPVFSRSVPADKDEYRLCLVSWDRPGLRKILEDAEGLPVILLKGFGGNEEIPRLPEGRGLTVLEKPFSVEALLRVLRENVPPSALG